jgi:hypothetical protein
VKANKRRNFDELVLVLRTRSSLGDWYQQFYLPAHVLDLGMSTLGLGKKLFFFDRGIIYRYFTSILLVNYHPENGILADYVPKVT